LKKTFSLFFCTRQSQSFKVRPDFFYEYYLFLIDDDKFSLTYQQKNKDEIEEKKSNKLLFWQERGKK
jgi:hypothetical protein